MNFDVPNSAGRLKGVSAQQILNCTKALEASGEASVIRNSSPEQLIAMSKEYDRLSRSSAFANGRDPGNLKETDSPEAKQYLAEYRAALPSERMAGAAAKLMLVAEQMNKLASAYKRQLM